MPHDELNHTEILLQLSREMSAVNSTLTAMKETMDKGFHFLKEENDDIKEKHIALATKVTRIQTIGSTISAGLTLAILALTAWWTRHL